MPSPLAVTGIADLMTTMRHERDDPSETRAVRCAYAAQLNIALGHRVCETFAYTAFDRTFDLTLPNAVVTVVDLDAALQAITANLTPSEHLAVQWYDESSGYQLDDDDTIYVVPTPQGYRLFADETALGDGVEALRRVAVAPCRHE